MPSNRRPVRNKEGFISAYKLWCQDAPIGTIVERTKVSDRTVTNWVNLFKEAPEEDVFLDTPFQSCELRQFNNFDWSQLASVLELVREYKKKNVIPTFRQAFWAQRLSHSVPVPEVRRERDFFSLFRLADTFVNHEIEELHEQPTTRTSTELSESLEEAVR